MLCWILAHGEEEAHERFALRMAGLGNKIDESESYVSENKSESSVALTHSDPIEQVTVLSCCARAIVSRTIRTPRKKTAQSKTSTILGRCLNSPVFVQGHSTCAPCRQGLHVELRNESSQRVLCFYWMYLLSWLRVRVPCRIRSSIGGLVRCSFFGSGGHICFTKVNSDCSTQQTVLTF